MSVVKQDRQPITVEELWEMPEVAGKRFELVDGELIEVPGASGFHNLIVGLLYRLIDDLVRDRDLGLTFTDGTGYILRRHPDLMRVPDVSFLAWNRIPEGGVSTEGYLPVAPDLAVEIVSPGDQADVVHDKVSEYLEAGVRLVWVLWPKRRSVTVHKPGGVARELGPDEELDGGEVLPGFSVRVSKLFDVRTSQS